MRRLRDYANFFRDEEEEQRQEDLVACQRILEWTGSAYHKEFLAWIDKEASAPFDLSGGEKQIVIKAARANTLREVQEHLLKLEREAQAAVQQIREGA